MAIFVQMWHGHEILYMEAKFFKDENGHIWFYYADNIYVRKTQAKLAQEAYEARKRGKQVLTREQVKQNIVNEVNEFDR